MLNVPPIFAELVANERLQPASSVVQPLTGVWMDSGQAMSKSHKSRCFRDAMVVALRNRVLDCIRYSFARPRKEIAQLRASRRSRRLRSAKHPLPPETRERANGCLLATTPLDSAERRIPIDERLRASPEELSESLI